MIETLAKQYKREKKKKSGKDEERMEIFEIKRKKWERDQQKRKEIRKKEVKRWIWEGTNEDENHFKG